jgi:hypothetical protein
MLTWSFTHLYQFAAYHEMFPQYYPGRYPFRNGMGISIYREFVLFCNWKILCGKYRLLNCLLSSAGKQKSCQEWKFHRIGK